MLNKQERSVLKFIIESSPDSNANHLFSAQDIKKVDADTLERLMQLGYMRRVSMKPDQYQITAQGRQFFRNEDEIRKQKRRETCGRYIEHLLFCILGAVVTLLAQYLFTMIFG